MIFGVLRDATRPVMGTANIRKFPVPPPNFPDLRNIFPVNLSRELREKSLPHSGFLLRNLASESQKLQFSL